MTEKEIPKGEDPKVPVREDSPPKRYATILKRGSAKRNPHVFVGTRQNAQTTDSKSGCNWRDKVCISNTGKAGNDKHGM